MLLCYYNLLAVIWQILAGINLSPKSSLKGDFLLSKSVFWTYVNEPEKKNCSWEKIPVASSTINFNAVPNFPASSDVSVVLDRIENILQSSTLSTSSFLSFSIWMPSEYRLCFLPLDFISFRKKGRVSPQIFQWLMVAWSPSRLLPLSWTPGTSSGVSTRLCSNATS